MCSKSLLAFGLFVAASTACGRWNFDSDIVASEAPEQLNIDCPSTASLRQDLTCTANAAGTWSGTLEWELGPETTCEWITIDAATGELSGMPVHAADLSSCVLNVVARYQGELLESITHTIDVHLEEQIEVGARHTCYLSNAGRMRCWGGNSFGSLGYNDTQSVGDGTAGRSIVNMGDVPIGGAVRQISLAYRQSCALLDGGGVRCWGLNDFSRLGYDHGSPVGSGGPGGSIIDNGDVPVGGNVTQIATGGVGGCVLLDTKNVRCWGVNHGHGHTNAVGGTGPGGIIDHGDVPIGGPVVQLAGGYDHFCALLESGDVRCWGENWAGALGYNHTQGVGQGIAGHSILDMGNVPVGGKVVQISAGDQVTCALLETGNIRCWGWNRYGQLGYNDTNDIANGDAGRSIVEMGDVPIGEKVVSVSAGEEHVCAVLVTGGVRCWGLNLEGQLGYNDNLPVGDGTPGRAIVDMGNVPVGEHVVSVRATGWDSGHTCAILATGAVRCWGNGSGGQLGYNSPDNVGIGGPGGTIQDVGDVMMY